LVVAVIGVIIRFFAGSGSFDGDTRLMIVLLAATAFMGIVLLLAVKTAFSLRHDPGYIKRVTGEFSGLREEVERKLLNFA